MMLGEDDWVGKVSSELSDEPNPRDRPSPEPLVAFAAWTMTFCAVQHCVFKFVTSITKEVFWKIFLSVWSKCQASYFAASQMLVELMSLHCSCVSLTRYHGQRCSKKRCVRPQTKNSQRRAYTNLSTNSIFSPRGNTFPDLNCASSQM